MGEETPKKDLTSLLELSALELAHNPGGAAGAHGGGAGALEMAAIEKITEEDFGDLETMSHAANKHALENPEPVAPPEPEASAETPAPPELDALPELSDGMPVLSETPPPEEGNHPEVNLDAMPSFMDDANAASAAEQPEGIDLPSHSQMGTQDGAGVSNDFAPPLSEENPAEEMISSPPVEQQAQPETLPPPATQDSSPKPAAAAPPPAQRAPTAPGTPPAPIAKTQLDPNRVATNAAPAGASHTVKGATPATAKQDMSELKKFADRLSIGKPKIEGAPAFSLLATNANGYFDERTIKAIENAITSEDFGIRIEDVAVQLSAGKLLVPQISEFAAITLAQKLRDVVDNIEVDLATEIFKGSAAELGSVDESILMDAEEFETHHEEVHDMGAEPRNENDIFTTHLPELSEFQVTRIMSMVMVSEVLPAEVAEHPTSKDFEMTTDRLTEELVKRAFKLGAHGVLGINFTLKPIESVKDSAGNMRRAYRLISTGTAVRTRKR